MALRPSLASARRHRLTCSELCCWRCLQEHTLTAMVELLKGSRWPSEMELVRAALLLPRSASLCISCSSPAQVGVLADELTIDPNIKLKGSPAPAAKQHDSPALASAVEDAPEDTALLGAEREGEEGTGDAGGEGDAGAEQEAEGEALDAEARLAAEAKEAARAHVDLLLLAVVSRFVAEEAAADDDALVGSASARTLPSLVPESGALPEKDCVHSSSEDGREP